MRRDLAPILFDDDRGAAKRQRQSVVAPAERSPHAMAKVHSKRTDDGMRVHSFRTLLADLSSIVRNTCKPTAIDTPTFNSARSISYTSSSLPDHLPFPVERTHSAAELEQAQLLVLGRWGELRARNGSTLDQVNGFAIGTPLGNGVCRPALRVNRLCEEADDPYWSTSVFGGRRVGVFCSCARPIDEWAQAGQMVSPQGFL